MKQEGRVVLLTQEQALERYDFDIARLSHKCPAFFKKDLVQELKLCVLQCHKLADSKLNDSHVKGTLLRRKKSFEKLERNRGIRYCPDDFDMAQLEAEIAHHYANIRADNEGKLIFSNTLG